MSKRLKSAAAPNPIQSEEDLINALARVTELTQQDEAARLELENEVLVHKQAYELVASEVAAEMATLFRNIQGYAEANRAALTDNGRVKTIERATGICGWRENPPRVTVRGGIERAVEALLEAGLGDFVRTTQTVDKDAILAARRVSQKTAVERAEELAALEGDVERATAERAMAQAKTNMEILAKQVACVSISRGAETFYVTPAQKNKSAVEQVNREMEGAA